MSAQLISKIDYSWYGKCTRSGRTLRTLHYEGFIKSEMTRKSARIHLGDFLLVEAENPDQPYVAQLLNLYEDDAQGKRAVVQWFSRFTEIPENKRELLDRKVSPQEVFYDETPGYNVDIALETIIKTVTVVPLHLWEEIPVTLKETDTFYVKQSWDGKCFKELSPDIFSKLKGSNEEGLGTLKAFVPVDPVSRVKKEPEAIDESAANLENSRTRSDSQLQGSEVLELLDADQDTLAPLKSPARKRKMNSTGILSSPSKIPCPTDKSESVFYSAEEGPRFSGTTQLWPNRKVSECSEEAEDLDMNENPEQTVTLLNAVNIKEEEDSQSSSATSHSSDWEEDDDMQYIPEEKHARFHSFPGIPRTCPKAPPETSRRSHAVQNPASLLAEARLSPLNAVNIKEEEDSQSSSATSHSSDWEEDDDMQYIPEEKHARFHSFPGIPRTCPKAPPETSRRSHAVQNPASLLAEARLRLHVSAVPESLPCREEEFQRIYTFVESKLVDCTGGCMYIAGMPGTGKTATVQEAIRCLQQAEEDDCVPSFQLVEINGMRLTDPQEFYVQLLESLTGQRVTAAHAAALLAKHFSAPGTNRRATVLVADGLDLLWTQKQDVLYNLFDWPSWKHSKLIVLAIANTLDLPERMMLHRVASRVCFTRMYFEPYTYRELQQIILSRLDNIRVFEEDAIQLVAALSGDARRCLHICTRATEICEFAAQSSRSEKVGMVHVRAAIEVMFPSLDINFIRNASLHEQIFLKATLAEICRTGFEEATLHQIYHQHVALCRLEGIPYPTISDIMAACSRLSACRLLVTESSTEGLEMRVRLNISQEDIIYALKTQKSSY